MQKLILDIGEAAAAYQDEHLRDLPCKTIEADEIWSFVYAKAKNVPEELKGQFGVGDVWTWTALCADTKLIASWYVGMRRFTRLTNGFSKKLDNHMAAIALHFMHYNFARPHQTLADPYPRTPAMAAGVSDRVWTLTEIAARLD